MSKVTVSRKARFEFTCPECTEHVVISDVEAAPGTIVKCDWCGEEFAVDDRIVDEC